MAIGFGVWFASAHGGAFGAEYFAGYIVEKSLSVDNLFVFVIIMTTFAVPEEHQHKVLTFGIVLALVMRAIFIAVGATLLSLFSFMFLLFGLLLIFTAVQTVPASRRGSGRREQRGGQGRAETAAGQRRVRRRQVVHQGRRPPIRHAAVRSCWWPSAVVDLLFALDSIPAVFGVTEEAYIVFTANAFALLGLRALFFLVKGLLDRLVYLSAGLAVILAFIGVKLILHWAHVDIDDRVPEVPTSVSLGVILGILVIVTVASLVKTKGDPSAKAHAGSLRASASDSRPKDN